MKKINIYKFGKEISLKQNIIELIICKNLKITKKDLFLLEEIGDNHIDFIKKDLIRLKNGEPLEYILGYANFYSLDFFVDNNVLIPRNDTEIMVDKALEIDNIEDYHIIDIGTGSGAIICSVIKNSKIKKGFAIDISKEALEITKKNINNLGLNKKIKIIESDLLKYFFKNDIIDINKNIIITANLPYVKNGDFINMSEETIKYEPNIALFGGENKGFELYERLIKQAIILKNIFEIKNLILFIEIGFDQEIIAKSYLEELSLKNVFFKDNSGINRCIKIEF